MVFGVVTGGTSLITGCPSTRTSTGFETERISDANNATIVVAMSAALDGLRYLMGVLRIFFGDNLLDFQAKSTQQLRLGERSDQSSGAIDCALALAARHADVGHLRLARTVHHASHDRHLDRRRVLFR